MSKEWVIYYDKKIDYSTKTVYENLFRYFKTKVKHHLDCTLNKFYDLTIS